MKQIFCGRCLPCLVALVLIASGFFCPRSYSASCLPVPAGVVSWWRAETNALDSAGSNNGVLGGNTTFGPGAVGLGFVFDGNADLVQIGGPANLQLQDFTIEAWVRRTSDAIVSVVSSNAAIFSYGAGGYAFGLTTNGALALSKVDGDRVTSSAALTDTLFHHLAVTKSGATVVFYVDGLAYTAPAFGATFQFSTPVNIGARGDNLDESFLGSIDELAIYNRALGADEIQAIYNADGAGKCPIVVPPRITNQPTNRVVLVGDTVTFGVTATGGLPLSYQWRFNGTDMPGNTNRTFTLTNVQLTNAGNYSVLVSNAAAAVLSSNAVLVVNPRPVCAPVYFDLVSWWRGENDVTDSWGPNNGVTRSIFVPGKVGQAFNYPFRVPDAASLRLTNAFTIEAWVNPSGLYIPFLGTIVSKINVDPAAPGASTNSGYFLGATSAARVYLGIGGAGFGPTNFFITTTQALPANQWSFVVATYDGAALRLYLNGSLAAQTYYSAGVLAGTANAGIGGTPSGANFTWQWSGEIDEVSLYSRALSLAEIQAIYNADVSGKCPVPPTITVQPQDQAVPLGEDALFSVSVLGTKPLSYQWRFNGTNLLNATNATLLLEKVQSNRVGNYSVIVTNAVGGAGSSSARLTLLPPPSCVPVPPGAISWWPAERSGVDAIGTNDAVLFEQTTYATGKVGQAFSLNGLFNRVQAGYPASPQSLNFGSNADFSIEGWIKAFPPAPRGLTNANVPIVEKRSFTGITNVGYSLSLNEGRLAFMLGTNNLSGKPSGNAARFISSGPDLRDGMFHHVAATLSRNSTTGGNLYLDGQPILTFDPTAWRGDLSNNASLYIGSPSTTLSNSYFNGLIDELAIYNRALSPSEVLAVRQAGAAGKCRVPPSILVQPVKQTVTETSNATFSVTATGLGQLRYQWFKNIQSLIPGATNSVFTITNAPYSAGGLYSVRVTNAFGAVTSSNVLLTINRLPVVRCVNRGVSAGPDCQAAASVDDGSFDPDGDPITVTQSPPGPYPLGFNPVTLTVTDGRGASNSCVAYVLVKDTTPPMITCPAAIVTTNNPGQCGAVVNYPLPAVTDACSAVTNIEFVPVSGSFLLVGTTPVNCIATDAAGNNAYCSFNVTVRDIQAPAVTCPTDIVVTNAHDQLTSVVTYSSTVSDNCPGASQAVCDPASGSAFGIGTHVVTCSATDAAGNAGQCSFKVTVFPGNVPPVPVIQVSPLADFPGNTNLIVIAPGTTNAMVVFDGSKSYDPDDAQFKYAWYEGTNLLSTNVVARQTLALGAHEITLLLDDTFPMGTNSATVTVIVLSPAEAVGLIVRMVSNSDLPRNRQQPLLASLNAASASFERGQNTAGLNQMADFQNKAQVQAAPSNPALASQLIQSALQILDAFNRGSLVGKHGGIFQSLTLQPGGKVRLRFAGVAGGVHIIQASTNLTDWQMIGLAVDSGNGWFVFEDARAAQSSCRFYRVMSP